MIRVLLADDHALMREGLKRMLAEQPDLEMVGEAGTGEQALDAARELDPDVVLMDLNMPGMGGMEAIKRLRASSPETAIVAITAHSDQIVPRRVLDSGVRAFVTKDAPIDELLMALRRAADGGRYVSASIAQKMTLESFEENDPFRVLSGREMQVLMMVLEGRPNQVISDHLCLSPKTVSTYRTRLLSKLEVSNDIELMHLAIKHGLVDSFK